MARDSEREDEVEQENEEEWKVGRILSFRSVFSVSPL